MSLSACLVGLMVQSDGMSLAAPHIHESQPAVSLPERETVIHGYQTDDGIGGEQIETRWQSICNKACYSLNWRLYVYLWWYTLVGSHSKIPQGVAGCCGKRCCKMQGAKKNDGALEWKHKT